MKRKNQGDIVIVVVTVLALAVFILLCWVAYVSQHEALDKEKAKEKELNDRISKLEEKLK